MRRIPFILALLCWLISANGQVAFKAVTSHSTVVLGESFQVQYIMEGADKLGNFSPPDLDQFRIIAGPDIYSGTMNIQGKTRAVKNWVYTLSCLQAGRFLIPGAYVTVNNKTIQSNYLSVEIITLEEAARRYQKDLLNDNSEYYLKPGEDPYQKINKNLFLKVLVDRRSCYVGEPVLATFKLYSRLESKSDIVKNPGFYGFAVYDMVNLSDKQVATENISGKLFDVHTIRKVQLYPLQDGSYTIDAMEVKNKVEFSRSSSVNKKAEQEIVEGVQGMDEEEKRPENTELFETEMSTEPLMIRVKPVPSKNKPAAFNGAVGDFRISARVTRNSLSRNEEGILEILVSGKGNFLQLNAPVVEWPEGFEGFEPSISDSMDKNRIPLAGMRVYRFPFVCTKAGTYTIPPARITYFNPDSGDYKSVESAALGIQIKNELKSNPPAEKNISIASKGTGNWVWIARVALGLLLAGIAIGWYRKLQQEKKARQDSGPVLPENTISLDQIMEPAYAAISGKDAGFYQALQQTTWKFFNHYLGLSGTGTKKEILTVRLQAKKVEGSLIDSINDILSQCETGMFGKSEESSDKEALWIKTKEVLGKIQERLL